MTKQELAKELLPMITDAADAAIVARWLLSRYEVVPKVKPGQVVVITGTEQSDGR